MADKTSLMDAMALRRSIYALSPESPISDDRILQIVQHALTHCPSPFNIQSARALILLGGSHQKLWDIGAAAASTNFPPPIYESLKPRLADYRSGYGTVLWFEDESASEAMAKQLGPARWAGVKEKMPQWSEHSTGMHQYATWMALSAEGLGCNLQHYNPFIDGSVQEEWGVPKEWVLKAQLVFGKPVGPPREKTVMPVEERVRVHKS
jgi:predicted oxidoreductase (fatty acid repression mutant protein)